MGVVISALVELNLEVILPSVPWSLIAVGMISWLYWRFTTGQAMPFPASQTRKELSKFYPVAKELRSSTVTASIMLFVMTCSLLITGFSLADYSNINMATTLQRFNQPPAYMAILLFLGIALVAGVVEEITFRGYMQTMMTERYGILFSFIFIAFLFAIVHGLPAMLLVPYMIISIGYSLLAQHSESIIPPVITHVIVDFGFFLLAYLGVIKVDEIVMYDVFSDGISTTFAFSLSMAVMSALLLWFICSKKVSS